MRTLQERLDDEWKQAMRSGDTFRRDTLSMTRAAVKSAAIAARPGGSDLTVLDDAAAQTVLEREAKKRRDAMDEYVKAGRPDRAESEARELEILQEFLPRQLSDPELEVLVHHAIAETAASGPGSMGTVMAYLKPKTAGVADGRRVSETVRRLLG